MGQTSLPESLSLKSAKLIPPIADSIFQQPVSMLRGYRTESGTLALFNDQIVYICEPRRVAIPLATVRFIFDRLYSSRERGIEVITTLNQGYYFIFETCAAKSAFYHDLGHLKWTRNERSLPNKFNFFAELQKICGGCYQTLPGRELQEKLGLATLWSQFKIDTFSYIYFLHLLTGRSNLTVAYQAFYPWLIIDVDSHRINLEDGSIYRDLGHSVYGLSAMRRQEGLAQLELTATLPDGPYMSHHFIYPPLCCLALFVRVEPYTTMHIEFQTDKFDLANRLFWSVRQRIKDLCEGTDRQAWECPPEFLTLPAIFRNENNFDLGRPHGQTSTDVTLPNWAKGPHHFTNICRIALESGPVSSHINEWFDLI
jgi:hypothetical protein